MLWLQLQGVQWQAFFAGIEQLRYPLLAAGALLCSYAILRREWKGLQNALLVEHETLAAVERDHPYLPSRVQIIATVALTLVCTAQVTPVAAKTVRIASSLLGLAPLELLSEAGPPRLQLGSPQGNLCAGDDQQCAMAQDILRRLPESCRAYLGKLVIAPVGRGDLHGFTDTYRTVTLAPTDDAMRMAAILVHECGHVVDFFALRGSPRAKPTAFTFRTMPTMSDDPSLSFYSISWQDANTLKRDADAGGFVSRYATLLPIEDFAETYAYYLLQPQAFRLRAANNATLLRKLRFMEELLQQEGGPLARIAVWDGTVPVEVTHVPFSWAEEAEDAE